MGFLTCRSNDCGGTGGSRSSSGSRSGRRGRGSSNGCSSGLYSVSFEDRKRGNLGTTNACCCSGGGCRTCSATSTTSACGNWHVCNSSGDFSGSSIVDEEILRENATNWIICDITSVALASVVVELGTSVMNACEKIGRTHVSRFEGAGKKSFLRITSNGIDLLSESKNDCLVDGSGIGGSRILMLLNSLNLRIDSGLGTGSTGQSNLPSIPF